MSARDGNGKFVITPEDDRFQSKIEVDDFGCWVWTAALTSEGYGQFWHNNRQGLAHRWAYERFVGPIPEGLTIDHLCRNRRCANPAHLEAVSARVNILRGVGPSAQHARKTECRQGHPYDEENTYVDKFGKRYCRECQRVRLREYRAEKKHRRRCHHVHVYPGSREACERRLNAQAA